MRLSVAALGIGGPLRAAADAAAPGLPAAGTSIGSVVLALALVLALIAALAWAMRRLQFGRAGGTQVLQVVAQLPLGPRERVVLVQVGEHQALLGVSPAGVRSLQLLDTTVETAMSPAGPPGTAADPTALLGRMRELLDRSRSR